MTKTIKEYSGAKNHSIKLEYPTYCLSIVTSVTEHTCRLEISMVIVDALPNGKDCNVTMKGPVGVRIHICPFTGNSFQNYGNYVET